MLNIFLITLFSSIECFNPDLSNEPRNYSREDLKSLFDENQSWNQGDIPLLNRKIFKGTRVNIREHPYVVSIRRNIAHYIVATMLTKNLFLTVAHPLANVPITELTVVVGENYADRGSTLMTVILLIIHEDFDPYTLKSDLALIRVYEDTPYRCSVKSIQLVHPMAMLNNERAFVTGWGRCDRTGRELCLPRSTRYTPGEKFDPMLRTVSFVIRQPNFYCEGYKRNGVPFTPGMLCAGRAREEDKVTSCLAVPGAPLVVNAHLAGILSWGFGCGYHNDLPLVYTSVQYFQPWLLHNIPILRRVPRENLTLFYEAKRAYILTKWLNMTRIVPPEPLRIMDRPLDLLMMDRDLAKLKGNVYDIRDYLFDGIHRNYKVTLYQRLRRRQHEKYMFDKLRYTETRPWPNPFLNKNLTSTPTPTNTQTKAELDKLFVDEIDRADSDSDKSYGEY